MTIIGLYPLADRARDLHQQAATFIETHVRPGQAEYSAELTRSADRWTVPAVIDGLKANQSFERKFHLASASLLFVLLLLAIGLAFYLSSVR